MQKHTKIYFKHYNYGEQDTILCEHPECNKIAVDIHHIKKRSQGGKDIIENLIALCRECHEDAERYRISHETLTNIHLNNL